MQIYGIKLNYFFRFGDQNNSAVFDLLPFDYKELTNGKVSLDQLYSKLRKNPASYIKEVKDQNCITNLLGIVGMQDGNIDSSNGIGKSTILEGICYVLYDKIVRKHVYTTKEGNAGVSVATRINNKYHPNMKESFVEIIFEEGGKIYRLKRGRKFSKNKKSNAPILEFDGYNGNGTIEKLSGHTIGRTEEESLRKVIATNYDTFVNGLMFGQGDAGKFLFGTDKVRKDMLINILNVRSIVVGQLEAIRKEKNLVDNEVSVLEAQTDTYKNKLQQSTSPKVIQADIKLCKNKITHLEEMIAHFDKEIEKLASSSLIKDVEAIKTKITDLKKQVLSSESHINDKIEFMQVALDKINKDGIELSKEILPDEEKVIDDLTFKIKSTQNAIDTFDKEECEKNLKEALEAKKTKPNYEKKLVELRKEQSKAQEEVGKARAVSNRLQDELDKFYNHIKKGEDFECSYCKTMVSIDHVVLHTDKYEKDLKEATCAKNNSMRLANDLSKQVDEFDQKLSNINSLIANEAVIQHRFDKHKDNIKAIGGFVEDKEKAEKHIESCKTKIKRLRADKEDHLKRIDKFKSDFKSSVAGLNKQIKDETNLLADKDIESNLISDKICQVKLDKSDASKVLAKQKEELGSLTNSFDTLKIDYAKYKSLQSELTAKRKELSRWLILEDVHGLDGIQTRIVKKYLPLLNSYIKKYLDILTEGEMTIDMKINDKSKIDMVITGGSSDTFEMLSGGEKVLVRLSVDISLALLSFVRSSQEPDLICLDEIFGQLDAKNTGAVFSLLNSLSTKFSRVLLISHKPYINDKIKNKIYINKHSGTYGMSEIFKIEV